MAVITCCKAKFSFLNHITIPSVILSMRRLKQTYQNIIRAGKIFRDVSLFICKLRAVLLLREFVCISSFENFFVVRDAAKTRFFSFTLEFDSVSLEIFKLTELFYFLSLLHVFFFLSLLLHVFCESGNFFAHKLCKTHLRRG